MRPDRFQKAVNSGTDAIIIDLEDAVPPEEKDSARANLSSIKETLGVAIYVRINPAPTAWHLEDLATLSAIDLHHLVLPKVKSVDDVQRVCDRLASGGQIIAQIESARGVENALEIIAHPAVGQLAFGPADFYLDMGVDDSPLIRTHVLVRLSLASKAVGKALPLDGPCFDVRNPAPIIEECAAARMAGAGGKLCVHPTQIAAVREQFLPRSREIEWARRVLLAGKQGGVHLLDGQMIDAPLIARARSVLQRIGEL